MKDLAAETAQMEVSRLEITDTGPVDAKDIKIHKFAPGKAERLEEENAEGANPKGKCHVCATESTPKFSANSTLHFVASSSTVSIA